MINRLIILLFKRLKYFVALDDEDVAVLDLISKTAEELDKNQITGSNAKDPNVQDYPPDSKLIIIFMD